MTDPLRLVRTIAPATPAGPLSPAKGPSGAGGGGGGPDFKQFLTDQIAKVNQLQRDAQVAVEDLAVGRRNDLENVMIATQKADTAFKLLLQVRNKMMEAYEDVKQIRV